MTTQIVFIRHGETDWNRIKRIQGHIDIPLAESGVDQAQQLRRRFAAQVQSGARLDAIWASDLMRAQQTAQPVAEALHLPVQLAPGLRERHYGLFQGHDSDEIANRFPDEYAHWQTRDPGFKPPEGESQREFYHRVLHALEPLIAMHPEGRIAVVTHGGVLDCVYRFAKGLPLDAPRNWPLLNTSVNVVDFESDGYVTQANIVEWGDVSHLGGVSADDGFKRTPEPGR
jgi:2,3-bisphosphoglycerate-dependent phosphoglycerate mutase